MHTIVIHIRPGFPAEYKWYEERLLSLVDMRIKMSNLFAEASGDPIRKASEWPLKRTCTYHYDKSAKRWIIIGPTKLDVKSLALWALTGIT